MIELVGYSKMTVKEIKICAGALEKILPLINIGFDGGSSSYYATDQKGLSEPEFGIHDQRDLPKLKEEYQKHIPECLDCKNTYIDFLNSIKKGNQSIEEIDKKYFDLLKNQPANHHS